MVFNKKIIIAAAAGVIALVSGITAAVAVSHKNKEPQQMSAQPIKTAAKQAQGLMDVIDAPVELKNEATEEKRFVAAEVKKAFIDDGGCARVIVHNNTNTAIVAYDLTIIYFDENGKPTGETADFTVNGIILSAKQDIGLDKFVGGKNGGTYIKAVIRKVLYYDGTAWENDRLDDEIAVESASFDTEKFKKSIEKNKENVNKAAVNDHLAINDMTMANVDSISGRRDLKLMLTNTSKRSIKSVKVAVAQFDRDNAPVDVSSQIYIAQNIRLATCDGIELKPGEQKSFSSAGFLNKDCYRINAIVTEITFTDGIVWKNPYALDWLMWFM